MMKGVDMTHENVKLVQQEKQKEALEREIETVDEASRAGVVSST